MKITLLHLNDSHGVLWEHEELVWKDNEPLLRKAGGLARVCGYVNEVRKNNHRVLFFDGGDTFHGTLPLIDTEGQAAVDIIRKMPVDGFVPGNWDFAYGKKRLKEIASQLSGPMLACNCTDQETGEPFLDPYTIRELDGVRVGIIGLTYLHEDDVMPPSFSEGLAFTDGVEEVRHLVGRLTEEVDLIVVLSHMGLPLDAKLAGLVDGIDVILSGHSHDRVKVPHVINGTRIVQAGFSASFLGRLDLTLEGSKVADADYQLLLLDETFAEDPEIREQVDAVLGRYEEQRNEVAGRTTEILHRMALEETPMDRLITDSYLDATGADAAFSHGWRYGPPIPAGPLTLFDLHSIIPVNPELFTLELTGREIRDALEKNLQNVFSADPFGQMGGYILRSSGITMRYKPYNPDGGRIQTLQIGGRDVLPEKTYTIAGGGGEFNSFRERKSSMDIRAIDAIRDFLKKQGPFPGMGEKRITSI